MSKHSELAKDLFKQGYNCSQAVLAAFEDEIGLDLETCLKIASSFGGGMGRLREVCGAVSGMFMVAGLLYGYTDPEDHIGKTEHYQRIQKLAKQFEEQNGSIVCRELLGLAIKADVPVPEKRTDQYYKKRPCVELVEQAAAIIDDYIKEQAYLKSNSVSGDFYQETKL